MTNTYPEAIDRLLTLADFERKSRSGQPPDWHMHRMETLLASLGNPHRAVPAVHVAGSKGKGSTSAMVATVLSAHGLRTGLYISPHLHKFTERIQVDGRSISEESFAGLVESLWPDVEKIENEGTHGSVSVFELLTAMAFVHFRSVGCQVAVIEVGLGGRLDATNVVTPEVSVITPISLDHVRILGDTITKIAREKAGIIKPGVPVVSGRQNAEARRVFSQVATENNALLIDALGAVSLVSAEPPLEGPQKFGLRSLRNEYNVVLPLLGPHQVDNARCAVAAVEAVDGRLVRVDARKVEAGLRAVKWPARCEIVSSGPPLVLVDGAHNDASAAALVLTIDRHFPRRRPVVFLLGGTAGHDLAVMARILAQRGVLVLTKSRHPKAIPAFELARELRKEEIETVAAVESVSEALLVAKSISIDSDAMIVATGSLFVAAEVRETVLGIAPELYPDLKGALSLPYTATLT